MDFFNSLGIEGRVIFNSDAEEDFLIRINKKKGVNLEGLLEKFSSIEKDRIEDCEDTADTINNFGESFQSNIQCLNFIFSHAEFNEVAEGMGLSVCRLSELYGKKVEEYLESDSLPFICRMIIHHQIKFVCWGSEVHCVLSLDNYYQLIEWFTVSMKQVKYDAYYVCKDKDSLFSDVKRLLIKHCLIVKDGGEEPNRPSEPTTRRYMNTAIQLRVNNSPK